MGRGSAGSRRARESGNPRVAASGTAPSLSLRAGGAWHSGGCTAVPALCSGVGRLYLSVVILFSSLLLSVAGGGVCVCVVRAAVLCCPSTRPATARGTQSQLLLSSSSDLKKKKKKWI